MRTPGTKDKILIIGRALLQRHGYNGFSFQDIANKLGIKKPSLYDHFARKDDLIIAIIQEYSGQFDNWAESIATLPPLERVRRVFDVFHAFASDRRKVCPVLALTADFQGLSKEIRNEMRGFVEKWLDWLEAQIRAGQKEKQIRADLPAKALADLVYSQGMGSQFQARIRDEPDLMLSSGDAIVSLLKR